MYLYLGGPLFVEKLLVWVEKTAQGSKPDQLNLTPARIERPT